MTCSYFCSPFCTEVRVALLSCVKGAWTAAKPVRGSSYFDTLKHLPSLKHGSERHTENNRERASFQPLLYGWSSADCLSLKSIKGQCSLLPSSPLSHRRKHFNGHCKSYTHFFPPFSTISPFTIKGQNGGISQKEIPELKRRCLWFLRPIPPSSSSCYF